MLIVPFYLVMFMKFVFNILLVLISLSSAHADDKFSMKINAYIDTYIATDNDKQPKPWDTISGTKKRTLASVGMLKDEFGINIAQIGADIKYSDDVRAKLVLQTGNLPEFAYSKYDANIQQASVGYRLFEKLWLDAGSFFTHIGAESYLPKDNWLSSHSLVTLFEPFYQQGIKATWEGEFTTAGIYLLNGNGILEDNNDNKSFGTYLLYSTGEVFSVSYSGIYGNEAVGSPAKSQMHVFHNICFFLSPSDKISLKAQFDYSTLEDAFINEDGDTTGGTYIGFSAQARYKMSDKLSGTIRFAYTDNSQNIYPLLTNGFDGMAITGGMEYKPSEKSFIRLEARMISMNEGEEKKGYPGRIFYDGKDFVNSRMELMLNFGVWFDNN